MTNLLVRRFSSGLDTSFSLTSSQLKADQILSGFSEGVSDWRSLAAMTVGGFAYRLGKWGALSSGIFRQSPMLARSLAPVAGMVSEVTIFRSANLFLHSGSNFSLQQVFDTQDYLGTVTDFAFLKMTGQAFARQNSIFRFTSQSAAMVAGHEASAHLGFVKAGQGSYLEKFVDASVTNLQMGVGMSVGHLLTGGRLLWRERLSELQISVLERNHSVMPQQAPNLIPHMSAVERVELQRDRKAVEVKEILEAHASLGFQRSFHRAELQRILNSLYENELFTSVGQQNLLALRRIQDFRARRKEFLQSLIRRDRVANDGVLGEARFVAFESLKAEADRIVAANAAAQSAWVKEALRELQDGVVLADCNFGRRETYLRVVDHHGFYSQAKNSAEQMLDVFESALVQVGNEKALRQPSADEVQRALQILNIQEVSTDNLADGGWCVWIAQNQRRVLTDPALRQLIREATHFEDFTAFGNNYERSDPAVQLQAAIFKRYGENLRAQNISGSDRFTESVAQVLIQKSMRDISELLSDSSLQAREAAVFWAELDAAKEVARESVIVDQQIAGRRLFVFYDTRPLQKFSIFAQWLSVPDLQRPIHQPDKPALQATIAPKDPVRGPQGEVPRILPIIAIPDGMRLPSGKGLLAVVPVMNAAEAARVEILKKEGKLAADFRPNFWFGKENVILPNPNNHGTLLSAQEIAEILMREELGLFVNLGS